MFVGSPGGRGRPAAATRTFTVPRLRRQWNARVPHCVQVKRRPYRRQLGRRRRSRVIVDRQPQRRPTGRSTPLEYADDGARSGRGAVAFTLCRLPCFSIRRAPPLAAACRANRWRRAWMPVALRTNCDARSRPSATACRRPAGRSTRRRRRWASRARGQPADAAATPLPRAALAPAAGARRHPRLARRAPAREERAAWEADGRRRRWRRSPRRPAAAAGDLPPAATAALAANAPAVGATGVAEPADGAPSDAAWIETAR